MLDVFLNVILPTFLVAAAGAGLQRWRSVAVGPLNQLMLYLLGPALVVHSLVNAELPAAASLRVAAAALIVTVAMLAIGLVLSRMLRQDRRLRSAFLLVTAFPNAANMALPVALLAFGPPGLAVAVIIFVVQGILGWSLAIYVAAASNTGGLGPLKQTLRLPILWAIGAALLLRGTGADLPHTLAHPLEMLAVAAIPVMLLVLGFQLSQGIELTRWPSLVTAVVARLVIAAAAAYGAALLLGLDGVARQTVIIVSAMPTAVFTTILATEFEAEPRFVTSGVIVSTLASLVTLTALIALVE